MDVWSKLKDWLKENPWWGALGFLIGVTSIIVAIILFMMGRYTKEPTYAIQSTNLIQDFTSHFEALEVSYAGERVSNLTATKVAFWNNGKATRFRVAQNKRRHLKESSHCHVEPFSVAQGKLRKTSQIDSSRSLS